jgi:DNA polymerase-1
VISLIEVKGFEADDLIGTQAKQAEKENYKVFMVTPTKILRNWYLKIYMYKPARMGNGIEIWV